MNFFAPWMLLGLAAMAIPPIIHLMHRQRARRVPFPALEFIRRAHKKTSRRFRFKQLLLMLMRSLLLGALALAMAQPFFQREAQIGAPSQTLHGPTIFVLDTSWSMAYRLGDDTLLDRARWMLDALLDRLDGPAALVIAGEQIEVPLSEASRDLDAVRRATEALKPSTASRPLSEAVIRAYDLLSALGADVQGRVVVLTHPRHATSALPTPPAESAGRIELVPVDVAEGQPLPNRAITDLRLRPAPQMGAGQWRIDAHVANYSAVPIAQLPIHLEVDGAVVLRGFLDLPPGEVGVKTFYTALDQREATPAKVVIEADALTADDERGFWLQPAPQLRVLAVNGEPHVTPYYDELFYFERAISPRAFAGTRASLRIASLDTLSQFELEDFDVILLANVPDLPDLFTRDLEAAVRKGKGLWVTMGPQVNPQSLNARIGDLLPRRLRDVRRSGDAAASDEGGDRRLAHPALFERAHPILLPFNDPATSSLARAKIDRYMLLDPSAQAQGEVIIALEDGTPLLLSRTYGEGQVILWTTSLDRDWSDLPIRPDYVPLVQQILRHLTHISEAHIAPVTAGQRAALVVQDQRVRRVQVRGPSGDVYALDRPQDPKAPWLFEATQEVGHYRVSADPPLPDLAPLPGFTVALDAAGSDLRAQGEAAGAGETAAQASAVHAALSAGQRRELWHVALLGLFAFLLAEALLLIRRRPQAQGDQ